LNAGLELQGKGTVCNLNGIPVGLATEAVKRPTFVISLDFELFWGVAASRTIKGYGGNVEGEWTAIPALLALFRRYGINATWATVGMVMCRNHEHWRSIRPSVAPAYAQPQCSTYEQDEAARHYPRLFFARPLVRQIIDSPGQELASHTYSHFYCGEAGATPEQFAADLACAREIANDMGVNYKSLVFPRNQVRQEFLAAARMAGIRVYRGNPNHWLYRYGHEAPAGAAGRAGRLADTWLPLSGAGVVQPRAGAGMVNLPASLFLRAWSRPLDVLEPLRISRLKFGMTEAARCGGVFHLWWHPHNFGMHTAQNLTVLEALLRHYWVLRDRFGMQSRSMGEFAQP
jgi:peptidoglycan/xylan/chitin deacetylase (PgdA/CDA1 family)